MGRKLLLGLVGVVLACVLVVYSAGRGCYGSHEAPGEIEGPVRMAATVQRSQDAVQAVAADLRVHRPKQILFGDLHVHTTFSYDAFMFSLPFMAGEGAHPPADACDFARYCSSLDFWSINDHAFGITPEHWEETVESIRQCNEVGGDPANPDTVAFLGWEWTQVGTTPDDHYGHKNVILAHTDDERIPARPIGARSLTAGVPTTLSRGVMALRGGGRLHDLARYYTELSSVTPCADDVDSTELPEDCVELASTPAGLFRKLDEWNAQALVIPHGTSWGFYTPPGASWDKQLVGAMHDPERQKLIEVYSGHGDSEVYRDFRAVRVGADGSPACPEPSPDYLPSCWQAGEIIRARCLEEGTGEDECEARAVTARAHAAAAGVAVHRTVPGSRPEEWLDAGQCRDCAEPSFNYRPGGSAQYIAAIGNFDGEQPRHFRMGFMASSDNHFARPGTGFKEKNRIGNTESVGRPGGVDEAARQLLLQPLEGPASHSRPFELEAPGFDVFETERQASFLLTGGLIAAHATGRDRGAIWDAMGRREVYGTSGPRILLWFDLINPPGSRGVPVPMGGEVEMRTDPIFQVKAAGSFLQKPGCPDDTHQALSSERIEHLCKGECYNPSDQRRAISRIEIVRIRPQIRADEPVSELIDDPWRTKHCDGDPGGCIFTFSDPDFARSGRDALYYARVFEIEKPGINAGNLRCQRDALGNCTSVDPCPSADGGNPDCLAPHEPRAWSSPIYVDHAGG